MTSQQPRNRAPTTHDPTLTTTYLLARITYLTTLLTTRFVQTLGTANPSLTAPDDPEPFHPYLETANAGMQVDTCVEMLIRAAEEVRSLGEGLRGVWLLGGNEGKLGDTDSEDDEDLRRREERVVRGMEQYMKLVAEKEGSESGSETKAEQDTVIQNG